MNYKSMYAAGIACATLFCLFYALALSGPHRAMPWLVIAYAIFPFAMILLISGELKRRRGRPR